MSLHNDYEDGLSFSDFSYDDNKELQEHKKHVRRMLEERLEMKRLKDDIEDELTGEFDWKDLC